MKRRNRKTEYLRWTAMLLSCLFLSGCAAPSTRAAAETVSEPVPEAAGLDIFKRGGRPVDGLYEQALERSKESLYAEPLKEITSPETDVRENDKIRFDCSCVSDGIVFVQLKSSDLNRIKLQITCGEDVATYTVNPGLNEVFPLSCGSGEYKISAFENVTGTKYAAVYSETVQVDLKDEFSPFLLPNQYVNYTEASVTRALADIIAERESTLMGRVDLTFRFVLDRMSYDYDLAATVRDGYVPDLDRDLERGKGICFDYAALMTAILRSMKIPCKLVTGYAGDAFHAWISVWSEEDGWLDNVIFFDGKGWQRADPTFADSKDVSTKQIQQYIGDGANYVEKHFY